MALKIFLPALLLAGTTTAQRHRIQSQWGQCGGSTYAGPTACPQNYYCSYGNDWYSQCVPGNADQSFSSVPDSPIIVTNTIGTIFTIGGPQPTIVTTYITYLTPTPTPVAPPVVTTYITYLTPTVAPTVKTIPSITVIQGTTFSLVPSSSDSGDDDDTVPATLVPAKAKRSATPTTLGKGQYWIRAVESPNFHKYLQTSPANIAGTAILDSSRTAGQFNIVDGQLVESTGDAPLYLNVEKPSDFTQRTLATWFNTTKNEFGTFVFQGDAVTWSAPEVKRQNLAAWLVCKDHALFINTGAYGYQTPSGCVDETIHYYNGATAND